MNTKTITEALLALRPYAVFVVNGDTLGGITWMDQTQTRPTDEEIIAKLGA